MPENNSFISSFTTEARHLADQVTGMAPTYDEDRNFPLEDSPLPQWFKGVLAGAEILGKEGPWPQFGRTNAAINWSTLIAEHPGELRYMVDDMNCTPQLCDALWSWAAEEGFKAEFDVDFHIEPDGAIGIWVFNFTIVGKLTSEQIRSVHTLMDTHGYQRYEDEPQITDNTTGMTNTAYYAWTLY